MDEDEIGRHKKEAEKRIGEVGNSNCQQKIRHFLKCAKVPTTVAFIFCNLSERAGDLLESARANPNIKSVAIFGNQGYPDHLDPSWHDAKPLPSKDVDEWSASSSPAPQNSAQKKATVSIRIKTRRSQTEISDPVLRVQSTPKEKSKAGERSHTQSPKYLAALQADDAVKVKSKVELAKDNLATAYNALAQIDDTTREAWLIAAEERDTVFDHVCNEAREARDRFIEAEKALGYEPIEDPSIIDALDDLVQRRESARGVLVEAAQRMHAVLDDVTTPMRKLSVLQHSLQSCISDAEGVLISEIRAAAPKVHLFMKILVVDTLVLVGISWHYRDLGHSIFAVAGVVLFVWFAVVVTAILASTRSKYEFFSSDPLVERLILSSLLFVLSQRVLKAKLLELVPRLEGPRNLGDLFRAINNARMCLERSLGASQKESRAMNELQAKVDNICSTTDIARHQYMQNQMHVAVRAKEELQVIHREFVKNKKLLNTITLKWDECLPEQRREIHEQKIGYEKDRTALKQRRRELDERLKLSCGTTDPISGNVRCWFPELFMAANWIWERPNAVGNAKQVSDALFDLIKADLRLDIDEDEVTTPPQNIIEIALAGRTGVQCKQLIESEEIKVWKIIPWPTVDKDAEDCLRRLKRSLCHSRRVPHPNILPCEGAIVRESPTDGRIERVVLQFAFQRGGDLQRWLERPRALGRRVLVLGKVADALSSMHRIGLPHRDIKPMNIVMSDEEDLAEPFLTDFEDSKLFDGSGLVTHRTLRSGGVGTIGFMAPELTSGVPREMTENTAESTKRWLACDVYSFAVTVVKVLCHDSGASSIHQPKEVLESSMESLVQNLSPLLDVKELVRLLACALGTDWKTRPTMDDLARSLSQFNCILFCHCGGKSNAKDGLLCSSANHFICHRDFADYIRAKCDDPIGDRRAMKGKFACPDRDACKDTYFSLEELRKHVDGQVFEAILRSEREIIQAEEAAAAQQREDELRRTLAKASAKELALMNHRFHITDQIATSRCPSCSTAWQDFSGCCALQCNTCKTHFCAFCTVTKFVNRRVESFHDSQACHRHVAICQYNPKRGEFFCHENEFPRIIKRMRSEALQEYLNTINDAALLKELRQDKSIRMVLSDVGLL